MRARRMLVIALLAACEHPTEHAAPSVAATPAPAPPDAAAALPPGADPVLRAIDWCNHHYGLAPAELWNCRGEIDQRHRAGEGIWGFHKFRLALVAYGDLTGDHEEDALLVFETVLQPVIIGNPPPVTAEVWVMQRRGDDLFQYTTESADTVPTSVAIADGAATLTWDRSGKQCVEHWRFSAAGETATKSAPTCR